MYVLQASGVLPCIWQVLYRLHEAGGREGRCMPRLADQPGCMICGIHTSVPVQPSRAHETVCLSMQHGAPMYNLCVTGVLHCERVSGAVRATQRIHLPERLCGGGHVP